ncbi:MAG: disulfide bond formation protein B [Gammaproteobacteria bacterium]|nr:disulfide bond formation protein B [Gammaproteobacteria bacterium]
MITKLAIIGKSAWYWLALVLIGLSFEGVALFYQHVLDEMPCALCIHVRLLVLAVILVALAALFLRHFKWPNVLAHLLTVVLAAGLLERAYQLLGTERGFTFSDCGLDLGLPDWLPLETWFPAVFKVQTSCGYTPELLFGITMAEALIVISAVFVLISLVLTLAAIVENNNNNNVI